VTNSSKPWGESGTDLIKSRIPSIQGCFISREARRKRVVPLTCRTDTAMLARRICKGRRGPGSR
jgi:hypothetical protein